MKIVWSRRAIRHLVSLRDYIADDNSRNAALVAARILEAELLATQPQMGRPGRITGTRELVVPKTPVVIPYRVRAQRLEIIAVFHGRQRWPDEL